MRGISSLMAAVDYLNLIDLFLLNFQKDNPGTKGYYLFDGYRKKINYILDDLKTNPKIPDSVRQGLKVQSSEDSIAFMSIANQAANLSPKQRELVETFIEGLLKGEIAQFVENEETRHLEEN